MQESLLDAPPLIETFARDKAVKEPSGNTPMCAINNDFVITTSRLGSNGKEEEEEEEGLDDEGDAYSNTSTGEWRFESISKLLPESSPNETTPASVAKKKEREDCPKGGTDAINCVCCWAVKIATGAEEEGEDLDPVDVVEEVEELPPPGITLPEKVTNASLVGVPLFLIVHTVCARPVETSIRHTAIVPALSPVTTLEPSGENFKREIAPM